MSFPYVKEHSHNFSSGQQETSPPGVHSGPLLHFLSKSWVYSLSFSEFYLPPCPVGIFASASRLYPSLPSPQALPTFCLGWKFIWVAFPGCSSYRDVSSVRQNCPSFELLPFSGCIHKKLEKGRKKNFFFLRYAFDPFEFSYCVHLLLKTVSFLYI